VTRRPAPSPAPAPADPPPRPPHQPALEDCCLSGCSPCIFDLYEDALERYRVKLAEWQLRHPEAPAHD
jgi:hypothetical protein